MARAGRVVAETLALLGENIRAGVTTAELDDLADQFIRSRGGVATFLGYRGFPASICVSPNDMVVHGIPGGYELAEGDVLSADVGVTLDGFVADSAYTFPVGEVTPEAKRLLEVGQEALAAGVDQARPGNRVSDISHAVQAVTEGAGYPQSRGARRGALHARGPTDPELRRSRARAAAPARHDARDRADDQRRRPGRVPPRRPLVDLH